MRLIDADVLKKDLTRFYSNEVTAKRLIDEQPTIEPEPHWIPCTERLPEVGQKVVVYEFGDLVSVCRLMESVEGELFWEDDNCRWGVYENYTEWIPLPEPYQEVEE